MGTTLKHKMAEIAVKELVGMVDMEQFKEAGAVEIYLLGMSYTSYIAGIEAALLLAAEAQPACSEYLMALLNAIE